MDAFGGSKGGAITALWCYQRIIRSKR